MFKIYERCILERSLTGIANPRSNGPRSAPPRSVSLCLFLHQIRKIKVFAFPATGLPEFCVCRLLHQCGIPAILRQSSTRCLCFTIWWLQLPYRQWHVALPYVEKPALPQSVPLPPGAGGLCRRNGDISRRSGWDQHHATVTIHQVP